MLMSEQITQENEARERGLRHERLQGDQASHERAVAVADERLAELKQIDRQLVAAIEQVSELPAAIQSRYGDGVSRVLGMTTTTADARLSVLAILEGARRDLDTKRAKVEAARDRALRHLGQVREALESEYEARGAR